MIEDTQHIPRDRRVTHRFFHNGRYQQSKCQRQVIVIKGTGGWADELASQSPHSDLMTVLSVNNEPAIRKAIIEHLKD